MKFSFVLLPYFLVTLIPFGEAIQCYFCTSLTDTRCNETWRFYPQDVSQNPTDCTQILVDNTLSRIHPNTPSPYGEHGNYECIKAEIYVSRQNVTIVRGCSIAETRDVDPCADLRRRFTNAGELVHCSLCRYDGCNGSSAITGLTLSFLVLIAFLSSHWKH